LEKLISKLGLEFEQPSYDCRKATLDYHCEYIFENNFILYLGGFAGEVEYGLMGSIPYPIPLHMKRLTGERYYFTKLTSL